MTLSNSSNDFTPADVVVGSTSDTLADNFVNVPDGTPRFASESYDDIGWTIGANYRINENFTTYLSIADSFRLPGFEDYIFGGPATNPTTGEVARGDQVENIKQVEGGLRYADSVNSVSLTAFYIDFAAKENLGPTLDDLSATGNGIACTAIPAPANCPKVRDVFRRSLDNIGIELEASYSPEALEGLTLQGSIVWQDPQLSQDNEIRNGIVEVDTNGDGVFDERQYDVSTTEGRRPRRQSELLVNFRPSYDFESIPLSIYSQFMYYSERFATDDSTNVTVYPAYYQMNLGGIYEFSEQMDLQIHIANLNDADSFTEGSPILSGLSFSNGDYTGVARPLLGRTIKASLTYRF
ncbi:TonB-dependent receptor domain-containing protein [Psychrosphaera algicola]|uniref:TonB-dependent receptor n=1 Tax=Psychrosphaera algicola TaxID=3023714 RepID=A0ABT5FAI3_9GAMM|nr:TonB-dependent receptor [Psychrosphaera sp. G1-22]MDC2887586.1 TonB-dependent receptor [Psychrosphaera sp. G1-22]